MGSVQLSHWPRGVVAIESLVEGSSESGGTLMILNLMTLAEQPEGT